jgi:hypothetical protein
MYSTTSEYLYNEPDYVVIKKIARPKDKLFYVYDTMNINKDKDSNF